MKKINFWRLIEPIILGSIVNIAVNFFFNPKNPDFLVKEFLVAFIFALIITEINHALDTYLEKKLSWVVNFRKRFVLHLFYLSITLLVIINVFGNLYIWVSGDSFHTWDELITINSFALFFAFFLTFVKWLLHFYKNWKITSVNLKGSVNKFEELKSDLKKASQTIELIRANQLVKINIEEIKIIRSEFGVVTIFCSSLVKGVFTGSLNELETVLPKYLFFRVNRSFILHRDSITALSSSTYGKIELSLIKEFENLNKIVISRLKASSFRKWYYSS